MQNGCANHSFSRNAECWSIDPAIRADDLIRYLSDLPAKCFHSYQGAQLIWALVGLGVAAIGKEVFKNANVKRTNT